MEKIETDCRWQWKRGCFNEPLDIVLLYCVTRLWHWNNNWHCVTHQSLILRDISLIVLMSLSWWIVFVKVNCATQWNAITTLGVLGQQLVAMRTGGASRWSKKSRFLSRAATDFLWSALVMRYRRRQEKLRYVRIGEERQQPISPNIMLVIFLANNFKRMFGPFFFRLNKKID